MTQSTELLPEPLPAEPLGLVSDWLAHAFRERRQPNPNAMVLATSTPDGRPAARVVLCKDIVADPGFIVFYTNYRSAKGRQLQDNPRAAVVMHWDALHRQVRIEGVVTLAPAADSDAYFDSRAWQSRVGAWASAQSEPVASRAQLLQSVAATAQRLGTPVPGHAPEPQAVTVRIPRPPHWGGYRLWADAVELWVEGEGRIHDRARWTRDLRADGPDAYRGGAWHATRLQP
ncbi:MAG: pyridoxamine 5'-phosphate oxidase [Proteobacteria bacterium]|nr:pyridoxamine 5'-phosphate oxidase [Pseudomonadota bacterium]